MTNSNTRSHKKQTENIQFIGQKTRRKPKRHIRPEILIVLLVLLCVVSASLILPNMITNAKLKGLGYTNSQIQEIKKEKLSKQIIDHQYYSIALAKAFDDKTVNTDYLELYTVIKDTHALSADDFLLYNRLQDMGYEKDQILNLFGKLEFWEITPLLVFDYQWDEKVYIDDCLQHRDKNNRQVFSLSNSYITAGTDHTVEDSSSITVLINRKNSLSNDYAPTDLTTLNLQYASQGVQLREEAAKQFERLSGASIEQSVPFFVSTGYMSYQALADTYNSFNPDVANLYADIPGQSEQQTGYAADVSPTYESGPFSQTSVFQWVKTNAPEYGFILRYPIEKATITGNQSESNQLRYFGKSLAKAISESALTYDEYYYMYLAKWSDEENIPTEKILSATNYQKFIHETEESE